MASGVIARVNEFLRKADDLSEKGHLLRAAEYYGRAAQAACALGEDNLVALYAQLRQGNMLAGYATAPDARRSTDPRILSAHRAEFIALFCGVMEALERRRVADTLREGKCAAVEVTWLTSRWQEVLRKRAVPVFDAASWATLVGYEQYLLGAVLALEVLARAREFAAECSAAHFQSFAQHVVLAAELMQQPRRHGNASMSSEAEFADLLRETVAEGGAHGLDARLVQLLAGAWERLQRSGVLQARRIDECIGSLASTNQDFKVAVQSSLTAPGLRSCALPGCGAREAHPTHFKSCAACRTVVYCCREHQVEGWPSHKKACKAARKAATADGAGPSGA